MIEMYMRQDPVGLFSSVCGHLPGTPGEVYLTSRQLQATMAKCEMEIVTQHETCKMGFVSHPTVRFHALLLKMWFRGVL